MEWIKASVRTTSEGVELVFGTLLSCGINGAQIIDPSDLRRFLEEEPLQWDYVDEALLNGTDDGALVEFYVTPDAAGRETLRAVQSRLNALVLEDTGIPLGSLSLTGETVSDEVWLNEWKKHYKPFHISKSVVVVPVWEHYNAKPGEVIFTIDPGSVFGTGLHQTTRLCAEALEEYIKPGDFLLDIGCGSGILSIIGLLLGAEGVFACDFDPAAAISARDNALRNPVNPNALTVLTGNILTDEAVNKAASARPADMVLANIVADVIIKLAPKAKGFLKPGGFFIASGIIDERIGDVLAALLENNFEIERELRLDGWYCVVAVNA